VGSAAAAFALLTDERQPERFHLLLCDIGMPEEDGYSLLRRFRQWEREHHQGPLPAVALTAHGGATDRLQALLAGFQIHVAKPIEPDELIVVTKSLIERKRRIEGTFTQ
jgi:CheY-like chemotaxis protein